MSKAIDTFNKSVGSYQQKINPQVRKLNDIRLNEDLQKQIVEPSTIDTDTRALPEPEDYNDSEE